MPSNWPAPRERRRARAGSRPRRRFRRRSRRASRPPPRSATSMRWAQASSRRNKGWRRTILRQSRTRPERSPRSIGARRSGSTPSSDASGSAERRRPGGGPVAALDHVNYLRIDLAVRREAVVDEVEVLAALHAQALHQPLARGIVGGGDGDHPRRGEAAEGEVEAGDRRLLRHALPPHFRTQPPPDLDLAGDRLASGRVCALQAAEAENLAGRGIHDDPEGEPELALVPTDAAVGRAPLVGQLKAPEIAHHFGAVHHFVEADLIFV